MTPCEPSPCSFVGRPVCGARTRPPPSPVRGAVLYRLPARTLDLPGSLAGSQCSAAALVRSAPRATNRESGIPSGSPRTSTEVPQRQYIESPEGTEPLSKLALNEPSSSLPARSTAGRRGRPPTQVRANSRRPCDVAVGRRCAVGPQVTAGDVPGYLARRPSTRPRSPAGHPINRPRQLQPVDR